MMRRIQQICSCLALISSLLVGLMAPFACAEAPARTDLYVSQSFQDYFYEQLVPALRERCVVSGLDRQAAYGWDNPGDRRLKTGSWLTDPLLPGTIDNMSFRYRDKNGNGIFDAEEDLWQDLDGNGLYDSDDIRQYVGASNIVGQGWTTQEGAWGKQVELFFDDDNGDGQWSSEEELWFDVDTFASDLDAFDAKVTELLLYFPNSIRYFINHTHSSGNWHGIETDLADEFAPYWSEESILAAIGANERLIVAEDGVSVAWFGQQRAIVDMFRWTLEESLVWEAADGNNVTQGEISSPEGSPSWTATQTAVQERFLADEGRRVEGQFPSMYTRATIAVGGLWDGRIAASMETTTNRVRWDLPNHGFSRQVDTYFTVGGDSSDHITLDDFGLGIALDGYNLLNSSAVTDETTIYSSTLGSHNMPSWCDEPAYDDGQQFRGWIAGIRTYGIVKWNVAGGFRSIAAVPGGSLFDITISEEDVRDTNRDDLVDVGSNLFAWGSDTGTMIADPERSPIQIVIPLTGNSWDYLPVHGYLVQGGFTHERALHLTHPDSDGRGLWQAYSLHTRARPRYTSVDDQVKYVDVTRPRGNVVTFTFAWDAVSETFSSVGYPTDINATRTYVLRDLSPADHEDCDFELHFDSGVIHHFGDSQNGFISKVSHTDGRELNVGNDFVDAGLESARYEMSWTWADGRISSIEYQSRLGEDAITVDLVYDSDGRITALDKSIAELSVSVNGGTITYGSGITMSRSGIGTVDVTTQIPGAVGSLVDRYVYNANGMLTSQTRTANSHSHTTTYAYLAGTTRYNNGGAPWGKLQQVTYHDGAWERFAYDSATGWLISLRTPFEDSAASAAASDTRETVYDYDNGLSDGEAANPNFLLERPRRSIGFALGMEVERTYYSYSGDVTTIRRTVEKDRDWDSGDNLETLVTRYPFGPASITTPTAFETVQSTLINNGIELSIVSDTQRDDQHTRIMTGFGTIRSRETTNTGYVIDSMTAQLDAFGRATRRDYALDATFELLEDIQWHGGALRVTGRGNTVTDITYTAAGWPKTELRYGITTTYDYDVLRNITKTARRASGLVSTTHAQFDSLSRQRSSTDAMGRTTTYTHLDTTTTTAYNDGSQRVEERFLDGRIDSVSGSATTPMAYEYGVDNSDGFYTEAQTATASGHTHLRREYVNHFGEVHKIARSDGPGVFVPVQDIGFDDNGRPDQQTDGDGVNVLSVYNGRSELVSQTIDLNGNGVPDPNDRITGFQRDYTTYQGQDVYRTVVTGPGDNPDVLTTYASVDGLQQWRIRNGRETHQKTEIGDQPGERTTTTTNPDGTYTVSYERAGVLRTVSAFSADAELTDQMTYSYDALLRQIGEKDLKTGLTSYTLNAAGERERVHRANGEVVEIARDARGRENKIQLPDQSELKTTYDGRGRVTERTGPGTYPQHLSYHPDGQQEQLRTYQDGLGGNQLATTEWQQDVHSGRMTAKTIAGIETEAWEWTVAGRMRQRTTGDVSTTATFDTAGAVQAIDTSGNDANLSIVRDRVGRASMVSDVIGEHRFTYTADGDIQTQSLPQLKDAELVYDYDEQRRLRTLSLLVSGSEIARYDYGYGENGQLASVGDGETTVAYEYHEDASVLAATVVSHRGMERLRTEREEDALDRLQTLTTTRGGVELLRNTYSYDPRGQRDGWELRQRLVDGDNRELSWTYSYDGLGQLQKAQASVPGGAAISGMQWSYDHDTIGNRITGGQANGGLVGEEVNQAELATNRLIAHSTPGHAHVIGQAAPNATVTVNGQAATRNGDWFRATLPVDNELGPVDLAVTVTAVIPGVARTEDVVAEHSGTVHVPAANESFVHDAAGNTVTDGQFTAEWDSVNRLKALESVLGIPDTERIRLEFDYDFAGRRVRKRAYRYHVDSGQFELERLYLFVYYGWNLIYEETRRPIVADNTARSSGPIPLSDTQRIAVSRHLWGLDLSQTRQGAGGIGGLVASRTRNWETGETTTLLPIYDGNGNILSEVDAETGDIVATQLYSPFGRRIGGESRLSHGFSSKYQDPESGLIYFGLRYYAPRLGRWINRDPIREAGGENMYAYVKNDPVNNVDPIGLALYAFDGTNNHPGQEDDGVPSPTNVRKFGLLYNSGSVAYFRGVGNPIDNTNPVKRLGGLMSGLGGKEILQNAMTTLRQNFARGDTTIDVVGFSRGASLALEFSNMVNDEFPEAKIRFLGLWDTVGAFGIAENPAQLPADAVEHYLGGVVSFPLRLGVLTWVPDRVFQRTNIGYRLSVPANVESAFHAMALHETRSAFDVTRLAGADEMWFYGIHSNIGGSYKDSGLSDIALMWMLDKATASGIGFNLDTTGLGFKIRPHTMGVLRNEEAPIYGKITREIRPGDKIHSSALRRLRFEKTLNSTR